MRPSLKPVCRPARAACRGGLGVCVFLLVAAGGARVAESADPVPSPTGEYLLTAFGDTATPAAAQATLDAACNWIIANGGGLLTVPPGVTPGLAVRNLYQRDRESGPTVTVRDLRNGYEVRHLPSVGQASPTGWYGQYLYRLVNMAGHGLPFQGSHDMVGLRNAVVRGGSSYMQWTSAPAAKGADQRIYVPSIRGIFVGQYLTFCGSPLYGQPIDRIWVKAIGWDAERRLHYLVADLDNDHPKGAILYNKHVVGSLGVEATANCDNQTMEFQVTRRQYAHGDSFLISGGYVYQGDVFSGLGDENGVVLNAEVCFDPDPFHGVVASVDWARDAIAFRGGVCNVQKLATSRAIINMNPEKWLTAGTVFIVPPDNWSGMLVANPAFDAHTVIAEGLDLAKFPLTWQDQGQEKPGLTTWQGQPVRAVRYPFRGRAYPSLITDNVNYIGGCIIGSPDCGWGPEVVGRFFAVADPGEYLAPGETTAGGFYLGGAVARNCYRWYLIKQFRRAADGTCAIKIERIRWAAVDAGAPNLYNAENYTWDGHERPLAYIIAPGAFAYDVGDGWRDAPGGDTPGGIVRVVPTGDRDTPFDFAPGDPIEQAVGADPAIPTPIRIRVFNGIPGTLEPAGLSMSNLGKVAMHAGISIGGAGLNRDELAQRKDRQPAWLRGLDIGTVTETGVRFGADVTDAAIRFDQPNGRAQPVKWRHLEGETSLSVDPQTGDLAITGGALDVGAAKGLHGLSATATAAANLRGINLPAPAGVHRLEVTFPTPEPDAAYAVAVQPNWLTADRLAAKTPAGFVVEFAEPAPAGAAIDWVLVR